MTILDVLKSGIEQTNKDEISLEMLADFSNHKIGMMIGDTEITLIVKDGKASIEEGVLADSHVVMKIGADVVCGSIDNSIDLMDIKGNAELVKGDLNDPDVPVHFMATFPFFDAMVRYYEEDSTFKQNVDAVKASL
jgi:hypothetical protein